MVRHAFAHPWLLTSLVVLPLLGLLGLWARWRRRQALVKLGDRITLEGQMVRGRWWNRIRTFLLPPTVMLLALGSAGPQWGRNWDEALAQGRDLIVVLDCSRSMLAEQPTRLERARGWLMELAQTLRRRGGHRVALIVFAGRAQLLCPLTHDYAHFQETVEHLDLATLDLTPTKEDPSGTRLEKGLQLALETSDPRYPENTDILLLSDGDDPSRDGEWRFVALLLRERGLPVHVVAVGDPEQGHRIPLRNSLVQDQGLASPVVRENGNGSGAQWLHHRGRVVRTRMQEAPLRELAETTRGQCTVPGQRTLDLGALYLNLVHERTQREDRTDALPSYKQRYLWFLVPGFVLLFLSLALPEVPGRRKQPRPEGS